jgi:ABC-type nitrate/sulfonate/bicarbonate transport system substrate-binding protein
MNTLLRFDTPLTPSTFAAHPKVTEVIVKAMDEAARIIHDDPRRAAEIYLAHEPSKTFDAAAIAAVLGDIKDEFGSAVHGIGAFADFMARHGSTWYLARIHRRHGQCKRSFDGRARLRARRVCPFR